MKTKIEEKKAQFQNQKDQIRMRIRDLEDQLATARADFHACAGAIQACDILLTEVNGDAQ